MKNKFLFFLTYCCLLTSCNQRNNNSDTADKRDIFFESLRRDLLGKWGWSNEAVFEILTDSIYYIQKDSAYPYQLRGDTFMVKFTNIDTFSILGKLKVTGDTLQIIDYNNKNFTTYGTRVR